MADRWTEFEAWCDEMIKFFKDEIESNKAMEKFCGETDITQDRIKCNEAKIKLFEIRKKHYQETGDSYAPKTPEVAALNKIIFKTDETLRFFYKKEDK